MKPQELKSFGFSHWLLGFKHKEFDTDLFIQKFAGLITGITCLL